jgi:dolichol-phosphate mannosyltransferase
MNVWVVMPTYNESENLVLMVQTLLGLSIPWEEDSTAVSTPHEEDPVRAVARKPSSDPGNRSAVSVIAPPATNGRVHDHRQARMHVLVVDDNSPDGTGELADRLAGEHPGQVAVLHRAGKLGLGTAYVDGFGAALQRGADVVVEMDADFSHNPEDVPHMVELLHHGADVVVGSRWAPGGTVDPTWERWRFLLSKYANVYARWVTGLRVFDTTAGFKAFRASALRQLPLERIRSDGYAFQIEVATHCQRLGLMVEEYPIHFTERLRGTSKMSMRIIVEAAWRVWQIRFR